MLCLIISRISGTHFVVGCLQEIIVSNSRSIIKKDLSVLSILYICCYLCLNKHSVVSFCHLTTWLVYMNFLLIALRLPCVTSKYNFLSKNYDLQYCFWPRDMDGIIWKSFVIMINFYDIKLLQNHYEYTYAAKKIIQNHLN